MSDTFPIHTAETAPEDAKSSLERTYRSFGMIPNLEAVMATAPTLLQAYSSLWSLFDETSLTPIERQVVYQAVNFENSCEYCVPWHTLLSEQSRMTEADVQALREGKARLHRVDGDAMGSQLCRQGLGIARNAPPHGIGDHQPTRLRHDDSELRDTHGHLEVCREVPGRHPDRLLHDR